MARPTGTRNPGYTARRAEIALRIAARLSQADGAQASLRDLAAAADVSVSTLRHYFGDRAGAITAALVEMRRAGEPWLALTRTAQLDLPLADSLRWYLDLFVLGWQRATGALVAQSLAAGVHHAELGPAMLDELLEPILQATEVRLAEHRARGVLDPNADLRHAALALMSPVLLALLHQQALGGSRCRPLDLSGFQEDHVARFVRAWGAGH